MVLDPSISYNEWQAIQGRSLLPLQDLRSSLNLMVQRDAKSVLDVGADMTSLAVYSATKLTPNTSFDAIVGTGSRLVSKLRDEAAKHGLATDRIHDCLSLIASWPESVQSRRYDFVRVLQIDYLPPKYMELVIWKVLSRLTDDAMIVVSRFTREVKLQLQRVFSSYTGYAFDFQSEGSLLLVRAVSTGAKEVAVGAPKETEPDSTAIHVENEEYEQAPSIEEEMPTSAPEVVDVHAEGSEAPVERDTDGDVAPEGETSSRSPGDP